MMSAERPLNTDDAWRFITQIYGNDDVKEACLTLQDEYGVDVSLLLFLVWLGHEGRVVPNMDMMVEIDGVIAGWRENVVKVLRNLRRSLKMMDEEGALRISRMILSSELEAEREALGPLVRVANMMASASFGKPDTDMRHNVDLYLMFRDVPLAAKALTDRVVQGVRS